MPRGGDRDRDPSFDATLPRDTEVDPPATPPALAPTQLSTGAGALRPIPSVERGTMLGRYVVLDMIGSGTMGLVVAAYDPTLDRKVALKLVRADVTGSTIGRQRLLREAQAMARLSHPNVVTVFEVGTVDDQVFLAMEYVAGTTLGEWCAAPGRTQAEIIDAFVHAGRGLAAAHRAGIVHRDFKPTNVLVAADGQVRVADFGLATGAVGDDKAGDDKAVAEPSERTSLTSLSMTATGAVLGTPAYMAPEQHDGKPADARADQFAFCVALHEALYRQLPFAGDDYVTYASHVFAGELREVPRGIEVPARLRRALLRGLATAPDRRYPGMTELLAELEPVPARARRRTAIAAAAAAGALVLAVIVGGTSDADPCAAAAPSLAGQWDAAIRTRIATGFSAASPVSGPAIADRVGAVFDRRAGELATMRRDACVATHVRRQQSAELLDRRSHCLDIRTAELAALAGVFATAPDAEVTERAISAALALPPVADCADAERLLAQIPPPADRATRAAVEQVDTQLALTSALVHAGKYKAAAEVIDAATLRADEIAYAPLRARAHTRRARVFTRLEKYELAIGEVELAGELAAATHDDVLLAAIWIEQYSLIGHSLGRARDVVAMRPVLAAAVVRAGNSPALRAQLASTAGAVQFASGDFAAAAASFAEARDRYLEASGPNDPEAAAAMVNRAVALGQVARFDEARAEFDQALAAQTAIFGTEHPMVARTKGELAGLLEGMDKPEEALAIYQEVAALEAKLLPPDHPRVASTHGNIAVVLDGLGRYDEALAEHERALAILGEHADDNVVRLATATSNLAITLLHQGRRPEGIAAYERALAMQEKVHGPDHPDVAWILNQIAIAIMADDPDRARALWQRVLAIRRAKLGEHHPDTAMAYALLAQDAYTRRAYSEAADLIQRAIDIGDTAGADQTPGYPDLLHMRGLVRTEQHQYASAAADFERALAIFVASDDADDTANTGEALAKAQWLAGPPLRSRAVATARTALEAYLAIDAKAEAAALRTWIAPRRQVKSLGIFVEPLQVSRDVVQQIMRLSLLLPIVMVLGMGCVVREPAYTTGYVAYGSGYPVYFSDGYYWSYYDDGWYLWSQDRWVVSTWHPRSPVIVSSNGGGYGHYGHAPSTSGMHVRDHRSGTHVRGDRSGMQVRDHRSPGVRTRAPGSIRAAPPSRSAPSRVKTRDHRR